VAAAGGGGAAPPAGSATPLAEPARPPGGGGTPWWVRGAPRHSHGAGREPLLQRLSHGLELLAGWPARHPTHGRRPDSEMRSLRHQVVGNAPAEDRQVFIRGGPVPTDVWIAVEDLKVFLHLVQARRRERR